MDDYDVPFSTWAQFCDGRPGAKTGNPTRDAQFSSDTVPLRPRFSNQKFTYLGDGLRILMVLNGRIGKEFVGRLPAFDMYHLCLPILSTKIEIFH